MTRRALLFDLDGTLLESAPAFLAALDQYCDQRSLARLDQDREHYASAGARAAMACVHDIDPSHPRLEEYRDDFLTLYLQTPVTLNRWYPGIPALLAKLHRTGVPWGIVTNKPRPHTEAVLDALLEVPLPALVCQGDLTTIKPDPAMLLSAAEQLEQPARACLYAGDHRRDIAAAKAAGMHSLACTYGYLHPDDDPALWGADALVHTTHALTEKALQWLIPKAPTPSL